MQVQQFYPQLSTRGITPSILIYTGTEVAVYKGTYQSLPAVIKFLVLTQSNYQHIEQEITTMMTLTHPNIVKIYDYVQLEEGGKYYMALVVEYCQKDLMKDIEQRNASKYPVTEGDLWTLIRNLSSAFAYMQNRGFAHRDIKPQNIFVVQIPEIKVGDFGSGKITNALSVTQTLVGTPFFLSPKLKAALMVNQLKVEHDVFKSDVFSLGVTLLMTAGPFLGQPIFGAMQSQYTVYSMIDSLQYSDQLKNLLKWMLAWDESSRCDFLQLENWLNPQIVPEIRPEPSSSLNAPPHLDPEPQYSAGPVQPPVEQSQQLYAGEQSSAAVQANPEYGEEYAPYQAYDPPQPQQYYDSQQSQASPSFIPSAFVPAQETSTQPPLQNYETPPFSQPNQPQVLSAAVPSSELQPVQTPYLPQQPERQPGHQSEEAFRRQPPSGSADLFAKPQFDPAEQELDEETRLLDQKENKPDYVLPINAPYPQQAANFSQNEDRKDSSPKDPKKEDADRCRKFWRKLLCCGCYSDRPTSTTEDR